LIFFASFLHQGKKERPDFGAEDLEGLSRWPQKKV
jgi:hypothetical protein